MIEYPKIQTIWKRDSKGRIQPGEFSCPEFDCLQNAHWRFTEKVDGTNIRVMWDGEKVRFGGRTDRASIPIPLLDHLQDLFPAEKLIEAFGNQPGTQACVYGEGFGHKIQKMGDSYNPAGVNFVMFDVRCGDYWLEQDNVTGVRISLGLQEVPVVMAGGGSLREAWETVDQGFESYWGYFQAEGLVCRPVADVYDRKGKRIIAKIKCADYARLR